jgi:hypothetical protein
MELRGILLASLAAVVFLEGCAINGTPTTGPNGQPGIVIQADLPQLPQPGMLPPGAEKGENVPLLGFPPNVGQVAQVPGGAFPPFPPKAPDSTGVPAAPAAPAAPAPTSPSTTPAPSSPGSTPLADAPAAPQATGQPAPAGNPLSPAALAISQKYGVQIAGWPTAQGLANLEQSMALYPAGALRGAVINFTGRNAGTLGGTWQTGGVINLYQEGVHVCTHELGHHIVEQNRKGWGAQLKQLLAAAPGDMPNSSYARNALSQGNWEEVAAEAVSYYVEGRWTPSNPALLQHLRNMITNQPGAQV